MKIKFAYSDPMQLSETLQEYGQVTRITQLESGEGNYSMAHKKSSCMAIAEISASKPLLYEGWGTSWSVDFNWITPMSKANHPFGYCEGFDMNHNSLGGFNTLHSNPGNSWGKYSESCSSTACMLDKNILLDKLQQCKAIYALDNLNQSIGLVIDHEAFSQLRRLTRRDLIKGILNPSKYYDLMTICLEEGSHRLYKKKQAKNQRLLGEIVNLSHDPDEMSSPMSLSDVCQRLNVGQASLYRVCQDSFGMGIIEMMTQVRLEEARRSMIYHSAISTYDNNTIREIAIRFGFKHQGRFSRRYFTSFGELPSHTLKRSKLVSTVSQASPSGED
jgi:AraC-like DNA-binding protein